MESGDEDIKLGSGSWLTGRRVLIGLAVLAFVIFLWKFPPWAIDRAHQRWLDCVNDLYETGHGEASECPHRGLLVVPKLIPWTRKKAKALEARMDYDEAEDALKIAAVRSLDAKARDRAANALLDAVREKSEHTFTTSSRLLAAGAEKIVVARSADLDPTDRSEAARIAARLGDQTALFGTAKLAGPPSTSKGIVACLAGDTTHGLEILTQADAEYMKVTSSHDNTIALAKLACDPKQKVDIDEYVSTNAAAVRAIEGGESAELDNDHMYESTERLFALVTSVRAGAPADDLLRIIRPDYGEGLMPARPMFSAWSVLAFSINTWPNAPAWSDDAASKLVDLAAITKPPKPSKKPRDEYEYNASKIADVARAHPDGFLRFAALIVELDAAYGWTRRGDLAKARASALKALELAHDPTVAQLSSDASSFVIATLQLVGEWTTAQTEVEQLLKSAGDASSRALFSIQLALCQAHAGKLADAAATIAPALTLRIPEPLLNNVRWLYAALALAQNKPVKLDLPTAPTKIPFIGKPEETIAYWLAAATGTPKLQSTTRWQAYDEALSTYDMQAVMPAVYYVLGKVAGTGDVELWLDTLSGISIDDEQATASARAEAARWRGDVAAAKRWDDRLAAMRALAKDDRSAYLVALLFVR